MLLFFPFLIKVKGLGTNVQSSELTKKRGNVCHNLHYSDQISLWYDQGFKKNNQKSNINIH